MGFWIFMMISDVIIPFTMLGVGYHFMENTPKEINFLFGYRTRMSMENKATWEFPHHYIGRLWRGIGLVLLIVTLVAMPFSMGKSEDVVGALGGILCLSQGHTCSKKH